MASTPRQLPILQCCLLPTSYPAPTKIYLPKQAGIYYGCLPKYLLLGQALDSFSYSDGSTTANLEALPYI